MYLLHRFFPWVTHAVQCSAVKPSCFRGKIWDTFFFYTHMLLGSFPRVKRSEHGADYPLPSSAVLWIGWSYNFASPLCLHRHVMGWTFCMLEQINTSIKTLRTVLEFVMLSMRLLNIWIMIREFHITYLFFFIWPEWWVTFQTSGSVSRVQDSKFKNLLFWPRIPQLVVCYNFTHVSNQKKICILEPVENISTLSFKIYVQN